MRNATFVTLSLMIFTVLILFANIYSVRPSAIAQDNANSDPYQQQKPNGYQDKDSLVNLPVHQVALNFQNIPNGVLLPADNVTTNFPQQQLPIAEPTTIAPDIVTQYQTPFAAIPPLPSDFGQYPTSPSYNALIPEPFTNQFPSSYQVQQQAEQRPLNVSMTASPPFQNPSSTGDKIFEHGPTGIENILDADGSRYRTNGNSTSSPVRITTSQPAEANNDFRPFIYSSTPQEDDSSLTLVPVINTTQALFPNLSQSSQYLYSRDMTNFDNTRSNTVTNSPWNNITNTNTNSRSPSLSGSNFNLTSQDALGSTLLDTDISNEPSSLVGENDTISSSRTHVTKTTPINKVQNITLSNVTTPHLGESNFNVTDPFSNETNSTTFPQSRGTSLPNDAAMLNSTTDAFLPRNSTAIASINSNIDDMSPVNEISASCDLHVALNETSTLGTDPDRTSDALIDQETLATSESSTPSCDPELAVSGNTTYVTWTEGDEEDRQIFFAKSADGGNTFARIVPMSTYDSSGSFNPQLAVSGNNVYVVWQEDDAITGNQDIFFKKSTDGGNSFTNEINLSKDPGGSGDPQIHVSGRNLYIVWDGTTPGANGIFLSKSTDGGDTFSSTSKLSNSRGFSFLPKIGKVSGNDVEVMWRNSENANDQVFSRKSTDGGASFTNIQRLSDEIKNSIWEEFSSHVNKIPFNHVVPR